MSDKKSTIPVAIQNRILVQAGTAAGSLVLAVVLWGFFNFKTALPLLFLAGLAASGGYRLYRTAIRGEYLVLHGTILKAERTALFHKAKALLLEAEGKSLRLVLRNRLRVPEEGGKVVVYVADTTPLYEWRGLNQLASYIAIENGQDKG